MPKKGRKTKKVITAKPTKPAKETKKKTAKKKKKTSKKKKSPEVKKEESTEPAEEVKEGLKEEPEETPEKQRSENVRIEEILQTPIIPTKNLPDVGELVIGTVTKVERHGAYVRLEEYRGNEGLMEGLIHVSEVSGSWVRNIKRYIRAKQKVVAKVLRINRKRGHIDLSLRRVGQDLKREKIHEWKIRQRENNTLALVLKECLESGINVTAEDIYENVAKKMQAKFSKIMTAFEEIRDNGEPVLKKLGIPKEYHKALLKVSQTFSETAKIKLSGLLTLRSYENEGVMIIRNALEKAEKHKLKEDVDVSIYTIGAPQYRIDVKARDYKIAREALNELSAQAMKYLREQKGEAHFEILKE